MEKTFQKHTPKLTYTHHSHDLETASIANYQIAIYHMIHGGYRAILNNQNLPREPIYASADAAKLAVERQLLESARAIVEILG